MKFLVRSNAESIGPGSKHWFIDPEFHRNQCSRYGQNLPRSRIDIGKCRAMTVDESDRRSNPWSPGSSAEPLSSPDRAAVAHHAGLRETARDGVENPGSRPTEDHPIFGWAAHQARVLSLSDQPPSGNCESDHSLEREILIPWPLLDQKLENLQSIQTDRHKCTSYRVVIHSIGL